MIINALATTNGIANKGVEGFAKVITRINVHARWIGIQLRNPY
jgi:hypothetical protein